MSAVPDDDEVREAMYLLAKMHSVEMFGETKASVAFATVLAHIAAIEAQLALVTSERDLALDQLQCEQTSGTGIPENIG